MILALLCSAMKGGLAAVEKSPRASWPSDAHHCLDHP